MNLEGDVAAKQNSNSVNEFSPQSCATSTILLEKPEEDHYILYYTKKKKKLKKHAILLVGIYCSRSRKN
jgi:hypothetical protein